MLTRLSVHTSTDHTCARLAHPLKPRWGDSLATWEKMRAMQRGEEPSTCDRAGGLDMGAMRLAVMPGKGLRLPALAWETPLGNRKPSEL